jgi:hypothetical protein
MKNFFIIIITFFISLESKSQINGLYVNENNEMLCVKDDSIGYRLFIGGAFNFYEFGIGTYSIKNNNLKLNLIPFNNYSAKLHSTKRLDDSITLAIKHENDSPMIYSNITFYENNEKFSAYRVGLTDKNGTVNIGKDLYNKGLCIRVNALGFESSNFIFFETGNDYLLKSNISEKYPFGIGVGKSKLSYYLVNEQEIIIKFNKSKQLRKFVRIGEYSCVLNIIN